MNVILSLIVIIAALYASWLYGKLAGNRPRRWKMPWLTLLWSGVVALFGVLQVVRPELMWPLWRDADLIFAGQWWRLLTAVVAQAGGDNGTIISVMCLLLVGSFAEQYLTRVAWLGIFMGGAILSNVVALYWLPTGGGTAVGTLALVGSLLFITLQQRTVPLARRTSLIGCIAALWLCATQDVWGVAVIFGMFLTAIFAKKLLQKV